MSKGQTNSQFNIQIQILFNKIAKSITSSLETSKIIEAVMEQIEVFFKPQNWSLLRYDPTTQELYFVIAKGMDPKIMKTLRLKVGEGIAGYVAQTGKSIVIDDIQNDVRFSKKADKISGFRTESIIAVPIIFQNNLIGVIELINILNQSNFTAHHLSILETIADLTAIALTNSMAYERISWIASHDPLTGLYNRAHLKDLIQSYQSYNKYPLLCNESDSELALNAIVIWIDVDNFKKVNDLYDHSAGDTILVKLGALLQVYCNDNTFAFRVGGDEFLIVFLNLAESNIYQKSCQLEEQLTHHSQDISPASGFSFGIAYGKMKNIEQLIKEADNKMYINKAKNKENIF